MDWSLLQHQADEEIKKFESRLGEREDDELLFLYLNKINEDICNLSSSVLISNNEQQAPFADALSSIVMLAKKMDVDLRAALEERMRRAAQE